MNIKLRLGHFTLLLNDPRPNKPRSESLQKARFLILLICAIALTSCAQNPPQSTSGKKLQLQTIYRGPMQTPTYLYHEVN